LAPQPEQQARGNIDRLLEAAGWHVCDASAANIHAARGVAIREFPLPGYGFADYLLSNTRPVCCNAKLFLMDIQFNRSSNNA
jgi:hypothetical protein